MPPMAPIEITMAMQRTKVGQQMLEMGELSPLQLITETFEHDKVRYLQQASMGILNMQQNQIVKVFTILTAVFLPPTLVGTMYGMNFAHMPELSWKWGFPVTILLTFLSNRIVQLTSQWVHYKINFVQNTNRAK